VDVRNDDGDDAFGPDRAHALVEEQPGLCTANADNYAWMALVSRIYYDTAKFP
jgi:hypothetical protein